MIQECKKLREKLVGEGRFLSRQNVIFNCLDPERRIKEKARVAQKKPRVAIVPSRRLM